MSVEVTREVMTAYLQTLCERGPYEQYFADDVTFTVMGGDQHIRGRDAVKQFIQWLHEQAFDARPEVKGVIVADGQATLEAEFVGTHIGEFFGVPASNHSVQVPYAVTYDMRGDKITALRFYMPMNVLMEQIGALAPAAASA